MVDKDQFITASRDVLHFGSSQLTFLTINKGTSYGNFYQTVDVSLSGEVMALLSPYPLSTLCGHDRQHAPRKI